MARGGWRGMRPGDFGKQIKARGEVMQKDIAEEMSRGVIYRSPKDTSRFLANNNFSVGAPNNSYDSEKRDASRSDTLANARLAMARLQWGTTFHIVNTTPYGEVLEHGYSGQAPQGIFAVTFNSVYERYK